MPTGEDTQVENLCYGGQRTTQVDNLCYERRREGLPVLREPAYAAKRSQDGEARAASE